VLGSEEFELLKPGSIIVQASSGTPSDKSAGEDNYREYKNIPRVIFSEKVGGDTYETDERRANMVIKNLKAYLAKQ